MAVFELFLADPMAEHHERGVIRETKVSKGSANKILRELAERDFLIRERKGRMVFYRLPKEPVVRQFKILTGIYMLKKLVDQLEQHSRRVVLFKSCAQGLDVKGSDIDLFILGLEKGTVRRLISDFNRKNEERIAPILVDVNEFVQLKNEDKPLCENIERGKVLWETE